MTTFRNWIVELSSLAETQELGPERLAALQNAQAVRSTNQMYLETSISTLIVELPFLS